MAYFRQFGGQIALLLLALLSVAISIYLTVVHYNTDVPLVCSSSGVINCERVLSSSYSNVPYTTLPVSLPGILWSVVAASLALGAWRIWPRTRLLHIAELVWGGIGLLSIFYLIYVEIVLLHTICAWCTAVHVLVLLYFLTSLVLLQSTGDDVEEDLEEEKEEITTVNSKMR